MIAWSAHYRERVQPNLGIVSIDEQERLRSACVGVAGCGAIGGHAAADLAYWGVGHLKLADFDTFETSNANRQLYAAFSTVGRPKLDVVAENAKDISPDLRLELFDRGITLDNAEDFVRGCDAVIDAIDYEEPRYSVALHQAARKAGIPVFVSQCIAFGASMLAFYPDGPTYEHYFGIPDEVPIEEIGLQHIDLSKLLPLLPEYLDKNLLTKMLRGEIEAPTVIAGQTIAVGLTVTEIILTLIKRPDRPPLKLSAYDPFTGRSITALSL